MAAIVIIKRANDFIEIRTLNIQKVFSSAFGLLGSPPTYSIKNESGVVISQTQLEADIASKTWGVYTMEAMIRGNLEVVTFDWQEELL